MSSDSDINNNSPQAKRKRTPPPGPNDVSQFPGDGPTQPNLMVYPAVRMGDRDRRFNKNFSSTTLRNPFSPNCWPSFCSHRESPARINVRRQSAREATS